MVIANANKQCIIFSGSLTEIGDEMLNIINSFTENIANTPDGEKLVSDMFHADPEIITNFVKLFIKSTH